MSRPTAIITFLFTDIEGSTKLWERCPEAMRVALARHDALLREAIERYNGHVFKTVGDAFCAAFSTAPDALNAALDAHLALLEAEWGETGPIRVRMGLHTGEAEQRDNDYFGQTLNRVARLQGIGHGQQTLISQTTYELVCDCLPAGVTLSDMGLHRLKDLLAPEHVYQLLHRSLPAEFPSLKSLDYLPTNLPRQMTSFIGREKEIAEVKRLVHSTPLLTLTGAGGTGKTRLCLQVGADLLEDYKDGVWLVELAALSDPSLVAQTVATALHLREEAGRPLTETLTSHLKDKTLLLLLDNCEHVLEAAAYLADVLLPRCPNIHILASSREGLGIAGEHTYRVSSLTLPDPARPPSAESLLEHEASRLFVERASAVASGFFVTPTNAAAVISVCRRLDGIPLAIELAAARVRGMSVVEIDTRLDNRFRFLTGGSRTALPRQKTLRSLLDWSYDLLNEQQKNLLHRLSAFAGGWTLEGAEQVGSGGSGTGEGIEEWEVLDLLTSLVDKSLVLAHTQGEATRYTLLETVRQYARDRLMESGESLLVRARHADCFLQMAEEISPKLQGREQTHWLAVLEEEHDNLRQALTFYAEQEEDAEAGEKGLRLAGALQVFWWTRGHLNEGRERLSLLLGHPRGQERTLARATALNCAGGLAWMQGDYVAARVLHEESLAIRREFGDRRGTASSLHNVAMVASEQGDYDRARVLYEQSLEIFRELGDRRAIANSLNNLGNIARQQGDHVAARVLHEESLEIRRGLGDKSGIASSLGNLGNMAYVQGDNDRARVLYEQSLAIAHDLGDKRGIASALEAFASLALAEAQEERGVRLWGAAAALREVLGSPLSPAEREEQEQEATYVQERLGENVFAAAWAQGQSMTMEQAIEHALSETVVTAT